MCVCVCVCVSKISEPSKYKVLKDAGKSHFPCATLIPCIIITVFCITGAKLMVLFEISKKRKENIKIVQIILEFGIRSVCKQF